MSYFQLWKDEAGEFRLTLKGGNHEIIFTTEGYTRKENALKAAKLTAAAGLEVPIKDLT